MKTIVILILFIGLFLIMNGVYEEKLKNIETSPKIVYKFIPRTYYEEQMFDNDVMGKMAKQFNSDGLPWFMKSEKNDGTNIGTYSKNVQVDHTES
jgi:hypothetical protein